MPTYQYACTACDERLEVVQKFSDEPLTVCTVCGGRLRKLFSAVGIVFKGSGFYRTDSRSDGRSDGRTDPASAGAKDSKANGSAPAAAADSASSSGEGKPEKKAEAAGTSASAGTKVA